jgi:RNA polymerase sigma-70 factor, ECF subfamily
MTFKEVYDEHFRFVWRSLRRLGVRESDVADAVQDVFLVVHRKLDAFEARSRITTWLFGIAMKVARDRRRIAYDRRNASDGSPLADRPDERVDVAAEAERRQGLAVLEALLDELPLDQRAVFTLFELDQMTGDQIAEMLEIPVGTVYSRLRLAREAFRASLGRRQAKERFQRSAVTTGAIEVGRVAAAGGTREAGGSR